MTIYFLYERILGSFCNAVTYLNNVNSAFMYLTNARATRPLGA